VNAVRHESGARYLLLERSGESSRVCDPRTGEEREVPNDEIEGIEASALSIAGRTLPRTVREDLDAIDDDRTLGLLREISRREPVGVRLLLDEYGLCESDLHGTVGELRAAGLIEPADPGEFGGIAPGDRGYRTTERARTVFSRRRSEQEGSDGGSDVS
jgi:hypothetical protein